MMLVGSRGQQRRDLTFDASGTITAGGTPQLLLPEHRSRSFLYFQNLSSADDMYLEFGAARATATISSGALASFAITNAGFGYTYPPDVELIGGGNSGNAAYLGVAAPGYPAPGDPLHTSPRSDMSNQRIGKAHAVLTGAAGVATVTSIAIEDPGEGYAVAPLVRLVNSLRDPFGVAVPSVGVGMLIPAGGSNVWVNGTFCPTDQVSIFCATTSAPFCCKFSCE